MLQISLGFYCYRNALCTDRGEITHIHSAKGRQHGLPHGNFNFRKRIRSGSFCDVCVARLHCMNVWIRMHPDWFENDTHMRRARKPL